MRRVRRVEDDVHVEMTPLIDVVFLLLTFFLFSIVMMIRADVLDVRLPELGSGEVAVERSPLTIVIDESGGYLIEGEGVELGMIGERVREIFERDEGDRSLVLAVDTRGPAGAMIGLADVLTGDGLGEFSILGKTVQEEIGKD